MSSPADQRLMLMVVTATPVVAEELLDAVVVDSSKVVHQVKDVATLDRTVVEEVQPEAEVPARLRLDRKCVFLSS